MYHSHFRGTHYEIGFRWGSLLLRHKNIILNHIPFQITQERIDFALSCIPIYKKYFPEILDEIQGIADGQACSVQMLQAVLFSMYAMPPSCNCSCFAVINDNRAILGRNSDFLTDLEKLNLNVIYKFTADAYSFTGNTTAFVEMEDGVNEHGLAVGLTSVYPYGRAAGFNAGLLLRYFLERCRNIQDVIACLKYLPISSAQICNRRFQHKTRPPLKHPSERAGKAHPQNQSISQNICCSVQLSSHLSRRTARFPILPPQSAQSQ